MARRLHKNSVRILSSNLTGKLSYSLYIFVVKTLRQWCDELLPGDMIALKCESALADKQYKIYSKWADKKESVYEWKKNNELKCFTFYKKINVE